VAYERPRPTLAALATLLSDYDDNARFCAARRSIRVSRKIYAFLKNFMNSLFAQAVNRFAVRMNRHDYRCQAHCGRLNVSSIGLP
jgi:hypothetical protein